MKSQRIIFFIIILVILTSTCAVYADDNLTDESLGDCLNDNFIVSSEDMNDSSIGKTIYVEPDETNPNQVVRPTVQPAIDSANSCDELILDGEFAHCHFTVNKNLKIIAAENATLCPCPVYQSEGAGSFGVFYIVGNGSGSIVQGFTFLNTAKAEFPFSFLIRNASDITIRDCAMYGLDSEDDKYDGIIIENSNNITLSNLIVNNTINGITIVNSSNIIINDCIISNNENQAILISQNSSNITIVGNRISNNKKYGIGLFSADYINILSNYIDNNGKNQDIIGSGVYVNTNITKIVVKGNLFLSNGLHAILYDYRVRNLNNNEGDELLTIVDNNYFAGHESMILHHRIFIENPAGDMEYDSENDTYYYVGNGKYIEAKTFSYMQHAFILKETICGYTQYTTTIPWALNAPGNDGKYNLYLTLSNITQIKKGVYQVSIIDSNGNVAADFNSFDVTFYLNNFSTVKPAANELYKTVKIQNGTATADFRDLKDDFLETGNLITASFIGLGNNVVNNPRVQFKVNDLDIPGVLNNTQINVNDLNVVYGSSNYLIVSLSDVNGKALSNKPVSIALNGKTYNKTTDSNGEVKLSVFLNCGNYMAAVQFEGDGEFANSTESSNVVVLKATPKITAYTLTTYPLSGEYFKAKLIGVDGKAISNQKISFIINGKSYSAKTDSSGMAKVKVCLSYKKAYSVIIKYSGNNNYKSISKIGKIIVKTGLKSSKIISNNIKVKRNVKKIFSFKLTSSAGKVISNQKVIVKVNGKSQTVKTSSGGVAKISVKFNAAKKYGISMKFLGNGDYKAVLKTNIINVV